MTTAEFIRAEVGGHSVAYRQAGEGPALVLLHGFLCDSRVWERQLMDLSDQLTVVAWDAPGAGSSSDPPDPFTMTDWGHCLAEFLDAWLSFARSGKPGHEGIGPWPAYDAQTRSTMVFDRASHAERDPFGEEREAVEALL